MKAKKLLRKRKKIAKKLSHTKAIVKKHVTNGEGKVNNNSTPVTAETTQAH